MNPCITIRLLFTKGDIFSHHQKSVIVDKQDPPCVHELPKR